MSENPLAKITKNCKSHGRRLTGRPLKRWRGSRNPSHKNNNKSRIEEAIFLQKEEEEECLRTIRRYIFFFCEISFHLKTVT
jgi:hypothetical protein